MSEKARGGVLTHDSRLDGASPRGWALRMLEFGAVQAAVQLLNAVSGLLIVRSLSKTDYAYFAIASSMQSACNALADIGVGVGLQSIGGRVWNQRERLGSLLNTALYLRRRFAIGAFAVGLPATAWMLWVNEAPAWLIFALTATVLLAVVPLLGTLVHATPVRLHGELRKAQTLDLGSAGLRLLMVAIGALTWINSVLVAMIGAAVNWLQLRVLRRWSARHAAPQAPISDEDRRAMTALSLKSLPNTVFFCIQGQVTLVILTVFGTTAAIADLTALGRLAAFFAVFSATVAQVLMPRFMRCQDPGELAALYLPVVGITLAVFVPLAAASWLYPAPFLWLLGDQYAALGTELGWVVTTACVNQVLGVMFSLNASKAWIRFHTPGFIPVIVVCQVAAAYCLDLREFHDVLLFNLVTAIAPLPLYVLDTWFGLRSAGTAGRP